MEEDKTLKSVSEGGIMYRITDNQAEILCTYFNKDIKTLEEYEICELLDKYIDELNK